MTEKLRLVVWYVLYTALVMGATYLIGKIVVGAGLD